MKKNELNQITDSILNRRYTKDDYADKLLKAGL
jgi:hypothetical protein